MISQMMGLVSRSLILGAWQIWTLVGHDCQGSCICTKTNEGQLNEKVFMNAECPVTGHSRRVTSVSANGNRVVSGSEDKLVKIWDADKGSEVHNPGECTTGVPRS